MGIEAIRAFFSSRTSSDSAQPGVDPIAVAACALLLEIALADSTFGEEERDRISRHAREDLGVPPDEVREVLRLAEDARRDSVDLYQFTRLVTEGFSREQRLRLIEAIWGVVYSDGVLSAVEGQLARRIAELLGFQHPEVQAARERVAARKGESV
ncbi:MAG TPA: TerB family tellurite resistance protein [Thermoanaerobaculia bacterium]|nr:TerB family tellurite resistance protein [Thermoanaerobaculia bacterium]